MAGVLPEVMPDDARGREAAQAVERRGAVGSRFRHPLHAGVLA